MRAAVAALVFSLAVLVLAGPCPNNCSGHGTCSGTPATCSCQTGWAGDDCSEAIRALAANTVVTGNVGSRMWDFYSFAMNKAGSALTFSVNQTNVGDCDLYLKLGAIPTRYQYDMRDIGTGSSMILNVRTAKAGIYYAGVYGYTGCAYRIGAYVVGGGTSSCPNSCSNHGTCTSSGVCNCAAGWSGSDCSTSMNILFNNRPFQATVSATQWNYYTFNITGTVSQATISVNQTSSLADCDLYIRAGSMPTRFVYDYSDKTSNQNFAVSIMGPSAGVWYAGVTGFTDCTYTITFSMNSPCSVESCPPGACSGHGACRSGSAMCICSAGYSGNNCESMLPPLSDGQGTKHTQVASGYSASANSMNFFHYLAFAADNVIVTLNRVSSPGSCALYGRAGSNPSSSRFDQMVADSTSTLTMEIEDPGQSIWYFGVAGWGTQSCNYTISVTDTDQCPNSCSNHGSCYDGTCLCDPTWSGDDCSIGQVTLIPGSVTQGSVAAGSWAYFLIVLPARVSISSVTVSVREINSQGLVWVFVSQQLTATLRQYDYADTTEKGTHLIHFERTQPVSNVATVYSIGVYGSPFASGNGAANFILTAWYPSV